MVPMDGRHSRLLDLDEFADAIEKGALSTTQATGALRRWQRFLDRHLHSDHAHPATGPNVRRPRFDRWSTWNSLESCIDVRIRLTEWSSYRCLSANRLAATRRRSPVSRRCASIAPMPVGVNVDARFMEMRSCAGRRRLHR
jgi:hypothetical protein